MSSPPMCVCVSVCVCVYASNQHNTAEVKHCHCWDYVVLHKILSQQAGDQDATASLKKKAILWSATEGGHTGRRHLPGAQSGPQPHVINATGPRSHHCKEMECYQRLQGVDSRLLPQSSPQMRRDPSQYLDFNHDRCWADSAVKLYPSSWPIEMVGWDTSAHEQNVRVLIKKKYATGNKKFIAQRTVVSIL